MLIGALQYLTVDFTRQSLIWLDNWPIGLKLNTELSRFLCLSFIGINETWSGEWTLPSRFDDVMIIFSEAVLSMLLPYFPSIVYAVGLSGLLGMTMIISVTSDILSIVTLSIYVSYLCAAYIFSLQLIMAGSLFNLFRGEVGSSQPQSHWLTVPMM